MFAMFALLNRVSLTAHVAALGLVFVAFQLVKAQLDRLYAASGYPVDYATGQLSFSAEKLSGWYGAMAAQGTLDVYWRTQFVDFAFLASVGLMGFLAGALLSRLGRGVWAPRLGRVAAVLAAVGAGFDAVENLLSFWLLVARDAMPQAGALIYSSAAALKFGCLVTAMLIAPLALVAVLWSRLRA